MKNKKEQEIIKLAELLKQTDEISDTYFKMAEYLYRLEIKNQILAIYKAEQQQKEIPLKVKGFGCSNKDRIVGYCPNCDGTIDIKLTLLVKLNGQCCSWCGQAIDLTGEDYDM